MSPAKNPKLPITPESILFLKILSLSGYKTSLILQMFDMNNYNCKSCLICQFFHSLIPNENNKPILPSNHQNQSDLLVHSDHFRLASPDDLCLLSVLSVPILQAFLPTQLAPGRQLIPCDRHPRNCPVYLSDREAQ